MAKIVTLDDVCTAQSSNIAQKDLVENCGEYPIYGASGFIKNVDFYKQNKPYLAVVKDGAGVGRVLLLPKYSSVIGTMQYILPKDNIDINFLYYVLVKLNLARYFSGATIPHIYFKDYKRERFTLPPLAEQRKIASVLDKVSDLISKRRKQLDKLDELVKARFVEMFGDLTRDEYKYETRKLGNVADVGSSHRVFTDEFVENGIPFYRGTEIGELANGKIPENPYYISEKHYLMLANDKTKPQIGDLLMPSICNKGQIWMVDTDKPFYYKDGRVLCISADREIYNMKYLQYYMRIKTEIEYPKIGSGSTFAEFKIFLLKDLDVLTPPKSVQNEFADFVRQTDTLKSTLNQSLAQLELLKKSLMQEYFG